MSKTKTSSREPFAALHNQGHILGPDGQKMSKSKGNVINPDDVVREYGADCLRMFEMFLGPYHDNKPWSTSSIKGVYRFLDKVWKLIEDISQNSQKSGSNIAISRSLNLLVKNIDEKIPTFQFNTCVSDFMKFINDFSGDLYKDDLKVFLKLLFPFAPIISAEGLSMLGEGEFIKSYYNYEITWPSFDPSHVESESIKIKIMIQNKFRGELESKNNITESEALEKIKNDDQFSKYLPEKISKVVYVPGKVLNII
jgi:leucyl-tRNA synthetase